MPIVAELLFGWPAILIFMALATYGTWGVRVAPIVIAFFFALGPSYYLFGANNWIPVVALYIPLSLLVSIFLVRHRKPNIPRALLVPIYCFYIWLGYFVATQSSP